ncbi:hypothetical protein JCM10213_001698 [Rhodosporidiobolus nylandii]
MANTPARNARLPAVARPSLGALRATPISVSPDAPPSRQPTVSTGRRGEEETFVVRFLLDADLAPKQWQDCDLSVEAPNADWTWHIKLSRKLPPSDLSGQFPCLGANPLKQLYVALQSDQTRGAPPPGITAVPRLSVGSRSVHLAEVSYGDLWERRSNISSFVILSPPSGRQNYTLEYIFRGDLEKWTGCLEPKPAKPLLAPADCAKRLADTQLQKFPNDVRLFFPSFGTNGAELWTSSELLRSISPYYANLFSSDFVEATTRHNKRPRLSGPVSCATTPAEAGQESSAASATPSLRSRDIEDSDDELDGFLVQSTPSSLALDTTESDLSYREVRVSETCYSTYRAVLLWALSGHITFSPLSSAPSPSSKATSSAALQAHLTTDPQLPLPVSPKSVYRLCHLLEISDLRALALSNFASQLTAANVAAELFSDTAIAYDEVRAEAMKVAVREWASVKSSDGFKAVEENFLAGELGQAAPVLMQLLRATSK